MALINIQIYHSKNLFSEVKYIVLDFPQLFMQEWELKWAFWAVIELQFYST